MLIPVVYVSVSSRDHPNIKFKLFLVHTKCIVYKTGRTELYMTFMKKNIINEDTINVSMISHWKFKS